MSVDIVKYRHGRLLYLPNDIYMGRFLHDYGEYCESEVQLLLSLLNKDSIVIECGSNIGTITIPMARKSHMVFAFEPQMKLYQMLCGNIALNNLENVNVVCAAVGSTCGQITMPPIDYSLPNSFGSVSLEKESGVGRSIPLISLDSTVLNELPSVRLLKADVEGMEFDVLAGADQLIRKHRPFLYVENDREERSPQLLQIMFGFDYRLFWHKPYYIDQGRNAPPEIRSLIAVNVLGVPREVTIDQMNLLEVTGIYDFPDVEREHHLREEGLRKWQM